jgi:hypothetical protein
VGGRVGELDGGMDEMDGWMMGGTGRGGEKDRSSLRKYRERIFKLESAKGKAESAKRNQCGDGAVDSDMDRHI